jgi:SAM-dependent methyltransferase
MRLASVGSSPAPERFTREDFHAHRRAFVAASREVLSRGGSAVLSEAAFPAYAHSNPLIGFLFWKRLQCVMNRLGGRRVERALDFGCGGGAMLWFLAALANHVDAADVDLGPLREMQAVLPVAKHVSMVDLSQSGLDDLPVGAYGVILALDVLEHVEDLDRTLAAISRRLCNDGHLFVSGPTENLIYRLGRRVAGPAFTGHYHTRNVHAIRVAAERRFRVETVARLFPPIPLFEVFVAKPR